MTKSVQEIEPQADIVTFYSCGPTVYDYPHIGNWYAFVRWDILNRTLQTLGYTTNWVMNITDVGHLVSDADDGEDKLEKGARREGKTAWDVASYYGEYFLKGLQRLHFSDINMLPKATDHIPEQIALVKKLEDAGFAYIISDGVYFDTSKLADYGKLAQLDVASLEAGARVKLNEEKRNITDFALWKFSPNLSAGGEKRDMEWESPWGVGFPGWHIECSAMSMKYLGETLDIHAGGIDHIPVHHTNEIAQSEAATGKPFSNTWVHSNFILVDGKKMSKSQNNFYTLEDIEAKGYSLDAFRLAVISSHYRGEAEFNWDILHAAQVRLGRFKALAALQHQVIDSDTETSILSPDSSILFALADDLKTPIAISFFDAYAVNTLEDLVHRNNVDSYLKTLKLIDGLFGFKLADEQDITNEQKTVLEDRKKAREAKDWALSDSIRDSLHEHGISVRDTPHGQIWSRL